MGSDMSNCAADFFRYLPVSQRDEQWGMYVTGGGFNAIAPHDHYPRPGHPQGYMFEWSRGRALPEYQTLYITRGEGEFESRLTGRKRVTAGSVILLFPGVWHRYRPAREIGWDEYWVSYDGDFARRLVQQRFFSPEVPVVEAGLSDAILPTFLTLIDRLRSEPVGFRKLIAADTMQILAGILSAVQMRRTDSRRHELIRRAKLLLEANVHRTPAIDRLAASIGLSTTHFYRIFREHTGLSPYQYHLQLRINRAKVMLRGTTRDLKQIAVALGFECPFHFSKLFKKKTGLSPSDWRRGVSLDDAD